jgi:plastocyanin
MRRFAPILAIIAVLAIAGAAYMFTRPKAADTASSSAPQTVPADNSDNAATPSDETTDTAATTLITYDNNGFTPANVTVKAGSQIMIINNSSGSLQFSSDPHPVHTDNPELNQVTLTAGKSQTFTVTKTGTWGYHNHLNSGDKGTIVVQ